MDGTTRKRWPSFVKSHASRSTAVRASEGHDPDRRDLALRQGNRLAVPPVDREPCIPDRAVHLAPDLPAVHMGQEVLDEPLRLKPLELQGDVGPSDADGGRDAVLGRVPWPDVPRRKLADGQPLEICRNRLADRLVSSKRRTTRISGPYATRMAGEAGRGPRSRPLTGWFIPSAPRAMSRAGNIDLPGVGGCA